MHDRNNLLSDLYILESGYTIAAFVNGAGNMLMLLSLL